MPRLRSAFVLLVLLSVAALSTGSTASGSPPGAGGLHPYVPGEVLVGFQPGARALDRANARAQLNAVKIRQFRSGAEHWKLGPGKTVEQAVAGLARNPHVRFAEPNYILNADIIPNDPRFSELWGMNNTGQTGGTADADIDAAEAWGVSTGSSSVLVGVIDTGCDYNHSDLAANIWTNSGEIPGNGIDDDNNGYVDDVHGYDFYNNDGDPMDDHGHGTHVSGTIGGIGDNGIGVAGVSWNVKIMCLKFLSSGGSGSTAGAIGAVDYSVMMGVDLTSNSWGGGAFSQALYDSINAAGAQEMAFVAAAGNGGADGVGDDNDVTAHYPSSYNLANIIAVAATDHNDARASFSNYGLTSVDLGAPGVSVLSTLPANTYGFFSGTSMATPHVSGVCALIRAVSPNIPVAQLKTVLLNATDPVPSMAGKTVSGGRLNAFFAIATPDSDPPDPIGDLDAANPTSNTMDLTWTATGDDGAVGTAASYDVRYSTSPIDAMNFDSASPVGNEPAPSPAGSSESMVVTGLTADTFYHFAIKAFDEWGNDSGISNIATGTTLPPPTGSVSPTAIDEALLTGEQAMHVVTLSNIGVGTLDFTIPDPTVGGALAAPEPPLVLDKGEEDPRLLPPQVLGAGGPDAFGYRWIDSDEPGGPAFNWIDISGTGTPIPNLTGDDQNSGPILLGFDFPFYGNLFDQVHVNTNGWLSFTSTLASGANAYSNQPLPTSAGPENMVAPFWDDLHFRSAVHAYFQSFGSSAIVQWQNVDRFTTGSDLTFQVILDASGSITYQYLSLTGILDSATVGIQNATKSDGLTVAFNQVYLHDELAVRISALPQWLTVAPTSGRLFGGESIPLDVAIDASGLEGGLYPGSINIQTNDPANPVLTVSVMLDVTGAPDAAVQPASLAFGDRFLGLPDSIVLHVLNNGTDLLQVTGIATSHPGELEASPSVFSVAPHAAQEVMVTWTPPILGAFSGSLTISSNDAGEPSIVVPVTGNAVPAPVMVTTPSTFSETLFSGQQVTRTLSVRNAGGSDLIVDTAADQGTGGTGLVIGAGYGTAGSGGPDGFGYRWRDSDESGGPVFDWVDISGIGTPVTWVGTSLDDALSQPVSMGMTFPFYGNNFTQVWVSTNGWAAFTAPTSSDFSNDPLPSTIGPRNLVAPFWDDLHRRNAANTVYTYNDGARFIIQYNNFGRISPSTGVVLTFQIILHPNGKIVYQYLTMQSTTLNSATIGIQNEARDTALQVSLNTNYVHDNMAIQISRTPDWLTVTPSHAVIPAGTTFPFNVIFDAEGRNGGDLDGHVVLMTNIPTQSEVRLPAHLTVIGAPEVAVYPASHDYGTVYTGYPHLTTFQVVNNGTAVLNIADVVTTDSSLFIENLPAGSTLPEAAFPLTPGQARSFILRWSPMTPYTMDAEVRITSDDPVNPLLVMPVTGMAIPPPIAAWSPGSFTESLMVGDVVHRTLHLENNGGSDLNFGSSLRVLGTPVTVYTELDLKEGEPDPRPGILGSGGPDMFGYTWKDSDEPGGPVFDWVDISGVGTNAFDPGVYCDNCNSGPIPIGFSFPFYGTGFNEVRVTTNGWLSFTSSLTTTSNQPLPNSGSTVPENLLALFWDDMVHRSGTGSEPLPSAVYYYNDGVRFIVQFEHFYRLGDFNDDMNFQVILYPSGRIVYQYLTMDAVLTSATIGIQNAAKNDGLTVAFNTAYLHDSMAIAIRSPYEYLQLTPPSGTIPSMSSLDLDLKIDTTNLIGGDYLASMDLTTNDPTHGVIPIPVTLHVTGVPDIDASPASLTFPTTFVGFTADLPMLITNVGTDVLTITGYSTTGAFAVSGLTTPAVLQVGDQIPIVVTFAPTYDGTHAGGLSLTSDDPDEMVFTVPFSGAALIPPEIGSTPDAISTALPPGGSRTKTLMLENTGGSDLNWSAGTNLISALGAPPQVTVYEELVLDRGEEDPRPGILGMGGPDVFGYRWSDSDEPGGPVFNWVDISGVGTLIDFDDPDGPGYCIDCTSGPHPIGFSFPFYGNHFNEVRVTTEGWISFTSALQTFTNQPLPNSGSSVPENLIASFWDDLVLRNGTGGSQGPVASHAYYHNDGTRFIVQWDNFYVIADSDTNFTFQVILYPSGKIVHQYLTMVNGRLNSATIGQQNATKDDGLTIVHNMNYMHDGLAIQVQAGPEWMVVSPESGTIPAGESQPIQILLDAMGLDDGIYEASIDFTSNDPYTPLYSVPVTVNVSLVAATYTDFEPDVLNLASSGNSVMVTVELPAGLDPRMIDPCSVLLNDTVPVIGCPGAPPSSSVQYSDDWPAGGNGIEEVSFRFDRTEVGAVVGEGENVPVSIQGEVTDIQWWRGSTTIRTMHPHITSPAGSDWFMAGWTVPIRWTAPATSGVDHYVVQLSRNGGSTWEEIATGVTGTAFDWTADASVTPSARVRVVALDFQGRVVGYDEGDGEFTLAGAVLMRPRPVDGETLYVDYDTAGTYIEWKWPEADLGYGMASGFRILTSDRASGGFTEQTLSPVNTYTDTTGDPPPGGCVFYRIVATNAAGDAQ